LQAEAEIQSSRAQQARAHAANIKQWRPSAQQKIAVVPRSVVVPQTSAVSRGQMQVQVRAQIQNEARMERQRQPAMDQMIRSHPHNRIARAVLRIRSDRASGLVTTFAASQILTRGVVRFPMPLRHNKDRRRPMTESAALQPAAPDPKPEQKDDLKSLPRQNRRHDPSHRRRALVLPSPR